MVEKTITEVTEGNLREKSLDREDYHRGHTEQKQQIGNTGRSVNREDYHKEQTW
jgi:hypothetical protein